MWTPETSSLPALDALRRIAAQEESITAARIVLFLFALLAAFAWARARPRLALSVLTLGGATGLMYWLIQMASPLGLGSDTARTRQWAQVGVSAALKQTDAGFVWGTPAETSALSALAAFGVPLTFVFAAPQIAVLLCLGLFVLLPRGSIRNPTTASFAGCLILGGGLWPAFSPYEGLLRSPSAAFGLVAAGGLIAVAANSRSSGGRVRRVRFGVVSALIASAAMSRSLELGETWTLIASSLLVWASAALASPIRAVIRGLCSSSAKTRRMEGLVILVAFGGGGLLWWDPPRTVPGFLEAKDLGTALRQPLKWIQQNVSAGDVVLASREYSGPIAALAGRRVLFSLPSGTDAANELALPEPARRDRLYTSTLRGEPVARLAEHFSITHLLLGPGEATPPLLSTALAHDEPRLSLILVYQDVEDFRVFRLAKK